MLVIVVDTLCFFYARLFLKLQSRWAHPYGSALSCRWAHPYGSALSCRQVTDTQISLAWTTEARKGKYRKQQVESVPGRTKPQAPNISPPDIFTPNSTVQRCSFYLLPMKAETVCFPSEDFSLREMLYLQQN